MKSSSSQKTIQSVERFLQILFAFTEEHPSWRLGELSQSLHLHPSTVSRILNTGKKAGVIAQNPNTGEYHLGLRILALSEVVIANFDLVQIALPILSSLVLECKEDAFLAVVDNLQAVTIAHVASPRHLSVRPKMGIRFEPNWTSGGKLILAHGAESQVETLIQRGLKGCTPKTIVDPEKFLAELQKIREQGFSISDEELEEGLVAIAAPVRDGSGRVVAAVSASGSNVRIKNRLQEIIPMVADAAAKVSSALGAMPSVAEFMPPSPLTRSAIPVSLD